MKPNAWPALVLCILTACDSTPGGTAGYWKTAEQTAGRGEPDPRSKRRGRGRELDRRNSGPVHRPGRGFANCLGGKWGHLGRTSCRKFGVRH